MSLQGEETDENNKKDVTVKRRETLMRPSALLQSISSILLLPLHTSTAISRWIFILQDKPFTHPMRRDLENEMKWKVIQKGWAE